MTKSLTPRQKEVLDFVTGVIRRRGEPPPLREIAGALGLESLGNIHRILKVLEKKGYVNLKRSTALVEVPAGSTGSESLPLRLTEARIYSCVVATVGERGAPPSVREIAEELGDISVGAVYKGLKSLEEKGLLFMSPGQAHSISLVSNDDEVLHPVVIQGVPCAVDGFLSPFPGEAWVVSLPLATLIPGFVEADASSVFGAELLDDRGVLRFSKGDYLLFMRQLAPKGGDVVAVEYKSRVIVRNYSSLWGKDGKKKVLLSSGQRRKNDGIGDPSDEMTRDDRDKAEDIEVEPSEVSFLGVAVSAIVRTVGARRAHLQ